MLFRQLFDLYGKRGRLIGVRLATGDEKTQYLRGTVPLNAICPTGRHQQEI